MDDTKPTVTTPSLKHPSVEVTVVAAGGDALGDADAEFGGPERRRELEKKLLWKLDKRMSILVLIYILNFVSGTICTGCCMKLIGAVVRRSTAIMRGTQKAAAYTASYL